MIQTHLCLSEYLGFLVEVPNFMTSLTKSWKMWVRRRTGGEQTNAPVSKQPSLCWPWQFFSWEEKKSRKLNFYLKKPRPTLTRSIHCLLKKSCSNIWFGFWSEAKQRKKTSIEVFFFFQRFLAEKKKNKWRICDWNISFDLSIRDELPGFDEKKR